jgi:hypothetical protein
MFQSQLPDFKYLPVFENNRNTNSFVLHRWQMIDDVADDALYPGIHLGMMENIGAFDQ